MDQSKLLEDKLGGRGQHSEAVPHAGPEVDRGGLLEVLSGTGNLADPEAEVDTLCEHLIVKDKTVGVFAEGQFQQDLSRKRPKACVVLRELRAQQEVLEGGQESVEDILVIRH